MSTLTRNGNAGRDLIDGLNRTDDSLTEQTIQRLNWIIRDTQKYLNQFDCVQKTINKK